MTDRDQYLDALRAGALLVVVLGHWVATLPRLSDDGRVMGTDHILEIWEFAGVLTWFVQVVPLFVFVSATVMADGVARRLDAGERQLHWWSGRALGLARPTVTYMAVIAVLAAVSIFTGGRLLRPFNDSLTIHLWFLLMFLVVQALLPLSVRADRRFGFKAVVGLIVLTGAMDIIRAGLPGISELDRLGDFVLARPGGVGWINLLVVWLIPQQLGIAWKRQRFSGVPAGVIFTLLGMVWLAVTVGSGYPTAMVGTDLDGNSNLLPPTLALVGVMLLQVGVVLLAEKPARWMFARGITTRTITVLSALSMPLYLWHKLAELPAAMLGEWIGAPIDAGNPGEAGFWLGRLWWLALCILAVGPVMAAVVSFEMRRRRDIVHAADTRAVVGGGAALFAGLGIALLLGALPGAIIGLAGVVAASWLLRAHPQPTTASPPAATGDR